MNWQTIRTTYPHRWVLAEALKAHSEKGKRVIEDLAVVDTFADGATIMRAYIALHAKAPEREWLFLHTDREVLEIEERRWVGVRQAP